MTLCSHLKWNLLYCPKPKVSFNTVLIKSRKSTTSTVSITVFRGIMKIIIRASQTSGTSQTSWCHRVFKDTTVIKETNIMDLGPIPTLLPKEQCLTQHYLPQCSPTRRCHTKMMKIIVEGKATYCCHRIFRNRTKHWAKNKRMFRSSHAWFIFTLHRKNIFFSYWTHRL